MTQTRKRVLSLLMAFTMLIGMMTTSLVSAETTSWEIINEITFDEDNAISMIATNSNATSSIAATEGVGGTDSLKSIATKDATGNLRAFNIPVGGVDWEKGGTYKVSFMAKASSPIGLYVAANFAYLDHADVARNYPAKTFSGITTSWQEYSFTFDIKDFINSKSDPTSKNVDSLNAIIMVNMNAPSTGDELWIDNFTVSKAIPPVAPVVESVEIEGEPWVNHTLTATAVVSDENEEDTVSATYQWQVKNGETWADISGADSDTYEVTEELYGEQLRVVATPVSNNAPLEGTPVPSEATETVTYTQAIVNEITFDEDNAIGMVVTNSNATTSIDATEGVGGTDSLTSIATKDATGNLRAFNIPADGINWEKGGTYTVSFMAKASSPIGLYVAANFAYLDHADVARNYPAKTFSGITTDWQKYSFTFDIKDFITSKADPTSLNVDSLNAIIMVNMNAPSTGDELWIDNFKVTKELAPAAPVVESVAIQGEPWVNHTLTATAVVSDKNEEDTVSATYQWQVKNGGNWENISGADEETYAISTGMLGKQVRVVVTPVSNHAPLEGTPVSSAETEEITYPKVVVREVTFDENNAIGMVATNSNATTSIAATEGVNGTASLKSVAAKDSTGNLRAFNIPADGINWEKGGTYTVSFMAKASGPIGLYVAANFAYLDHSDVARNYPAKTFSGITTDWQKYSFTFDIKDFITSKADPTSLNVDSLNAIIMVNMNAPSTGDELWIDNFKVTKELPPAAPVVESVAIQGEPWLNHTLTATADVFDENQEDVLSATYQWQVKNGETWEDISGAVSDTYKLTEELLGKQVRVVATPVSNNAPFEGTPVPSEATGEIIYKTVVVSNITFDEANAMGQIGTSSTATTSIDTTTGVDGTNSLKSVATKDATGNLRAFNIPKDGIDWEKGENYTVSFMAKASSPIGVYIAGNFKYLDEKGSAKNYAAKTFSGITTEWTEYSYSFTIADFIDNSTDKNSLGVDSQNALIMVNMSGPAANDVLWIDDFKVVKVIPPVAPVVNSVEIEGFPQVSRTLSAAALISDKNEEDTVSAAYQWQVKNGDAWENIAGAEDQDYTIPENMLGKQVRVEVTPVSNHAPLEGTPVTSEETAVIGEYTYSPTGKNAQISGTYEIGQTLTASYTYVPSQSNIPEGNTEYIWEVSADNETFTPVQSSTSTAYAVRFLDLGMWLRVRIIPKDQNGLPGEELITAATKVTGEAALFVSANGDDNNVGTLDAPLKTIEKARDTLRQMNVLPEGGVTVNVRGGIYPVSETITFTAEDSGTEESPITYQAYNGEKVSFIGGQVLDTSKMEKVTDEDLLDNLIEEEARDHLYMLDLGEQGVTMDPLQKSSANFKPNRIYMNNNLLTEARWPNDDQSQNVVVCRPLTNADDGINEEEINYKGTIIKYEYPDPENRSAKWNIQEGDAYIGGGVVFFWAYCQLRIKEVDVENKIVTSLDTSSYSAVKDVMYGPQYKVYFSNIFAEIDQPGESYVDRTNNILYFYPIGTMENPEMVVSSLRTNMISVSGASYVTFKGIDFKDTIETPVVLNDCDHVVIEDAEVSNITAGGIRMVNCTNSIITGCNFYTIGTTAVYVEGGDRVNLTPSGNEIRNNNFHKIVLNPASRNTAVDIQNAAGEWIHHNEFNDMNLYVIRIMDSNNVLIEYNKIMNCGKLNSDAGVINWGREYDSLGHTVRYNYFENIGSKLIANYLHGYQSVSIFTDDTSTGGNIYGNVFYNGGSNTDGTGSPTMGNGPEFSNVWGNISICTDFDKMSKSFLMRSWGETSGMTNLYGVKVPTGVSAASWLYQMAMRSAYGGSNSDRLNQRDLDYMWSDAWAEHYSGTQWENALAHYSEANYTGAKALFDAGNYAGLLTFLSNNLTNQRTNQIHDNVSLGAIVMDSQANHYNNYVGTQGAITEQDKALFVDFDNRDFTLTEAGLATIQAVSPEFQAIPFSQIGMTSLVGGHKPVVTVNAQPFTVAAGNKISASYTFADADGDLEGNTEIYWYVSDTADGDFEKIYGVEGNHFEVTDEYANRYLKYEIVPYDTTVLRGETVMSGSISVENIDFIAE